MGGTTGDRDGVGQVSCLPTDNCPVGTHVERPAGACCPACIADMPPACGEAGCGDAGNCPLGYALGSGPNGCCSDCVPDPSYCEADSDARWRSISSSAAAPSAPSVRDSSTTTLATSRTVIWAPRRRGCVRPPLLLSRPAATPDGTVPESHLHDGSLWQPLAEVSAPSWASHAVRAST